MARTFKTKALSRIHRQPERYADAFTFAHTDY